MPYMTLEVKMALNYFFWIQRPNQFQRGVICLCLNKPLKNGNFGPSFTLFGPSLGPDRSKSQKLFFLNSEAKPIPTRGQMPVFEQTFKNWYLGPKTGKNAKKIFPKMRKTSPGNIPTFRKTQENNFQDIQGLRNLPWKFCPRTDGQPLR